MEFNIVAVTKLTVGIGVVWLIVMGAIYLYLKRGRAGKKRSDKAPREWRKIDEDY